VETPCSESRSSIWEQRSIASTLPQKLQATRLNGQRKSLCINRYCEAQICMQGDVQSSDGTPFDPAGHCTKCGDAMYQRLRKLQGPHTRKGEIFRRSLRMPLILSPMWASLSLMDRWVEARAAIHILHQPRRKTNVLIVDVDGSNPVNLTNNPPLNAAPFPCSISAAATFSPDSTKLVFGHTDCSGHPTLWIMNADGSGKQDTGIQLGPSNFTGFADWGTNVK
jgi:hypothetical protein